MAVRQFAIKLNDDSHQTGDTTLKALKMAGTSVKFELSNTISNGSDELDLITRKNGQTKTHPYPVTISAGVAGIELSAAEITDLFDDADYGEWDYVEARWKVGSTDTPMTSIMHVIQNGMPHDYIGWPPNH